MTFGLVCDVKINDIVNVEKSLGFDRLKASNHANILDQFNKIELRKINVTYYNTIIISLL